MWKAQRVPQGRHLSKRLLRIESHSLFPEHGFKFRFVASPTMMLRLVLDVILHRRHVRAAHTERAVSLLPCELQPVLMQPTRGVGFHHLNRLCDRYVHRQRNEQMCVVGDASRGEYRDTVIAADTGEVLPQPGKDFFGYEIAPLRGAEDAMNEDVRVFVGHGREYPHSLNARLCRLSHSDGAVPKRDSRCPALPTRHFHAGLSHAVPSALELAPRGRTYVAIRCPDDLHLIA